MLDCTQAALRLAQVKTLRQRAVPVVERVAGHNALTNHCITCKRKHKLLCDFRLTSMMVMLDFGAPHIRINLKNSKRIKTYCHTEVAGEVDLVPSLEVHLTLGEAGCSVCYSVLNAGHYVTATTWVVQG